MIWNEKIEAELAGLGEISSYKAGGWLPETVSDQSVIRQILIGHMDIYAINLSHPVLIGRFGPGEILGIRANLYPADQLKSRYRAVSDIKCREIPWHIVEELSSRNSRLEHMMRHIAQTRGYEAAIAIHPVFSCLNLEERSTVFEHSIVRLLAPGERLIRKRGERSHLYLLVSGCVGITTDKQSFLLRGSGDILGEISLFGVSNMPTADVIAESFSEIIEFLDADMLDIMQKNSEFRKRMNELIGSRINT